MTEYKIDVYYGTVEIEQRPLLSAQGFGYETRSVWRNLDGLVEKIGDWQAPLCWLVYDQSDIQKQKTKSWWARLFYDA